ncbi:hypothetical protein ANN_27110, partial [Periplaneta americana]
MMKNVKLMTRNKYIFHTEAFYDMKRSYRERAHRGIATVSSFDYMQNLHVPYLRFNVIYYSHQLWNYCFGVHDLSNDEKKRTAFVQTPNQCDDIIASCRVYPKPFEVKRVHTPDFLNNIKATVEPYFAQSSRCQLKLKQLRMHRIDRDSPHVG